MFKIKNFSLLLFSILLCEGAGIIGSVFTISSIPTWYATLNKPFFSPPNYVFGPVWITLYAFMGISLYLVFISKKDRKGLAYKIFFTQLILNTLWSIIFFGMRDPMLAFIVIIILWICILYTIKSFKLISKLAAYLLYPYFTWVTFASILNFSIWMLNR